MVAKSMTLAERFMPLPDDFRVGRWMLPRFTKHEAPLCAWASFPNSTSR